MGKKFLFKTFTQLSQTQYKKGWKNGLKTFCTYESGYQWGLHGRVYEKTCPIEKKGPFVKGYVAGNKKCFYNAGFNDAVTGKSKNLTKKKLRTNLSAVE